MYRGRFETIEQRKRERERKGRERVNDTWVAGKITAIYPFEFNFSPLNIDGLLSMYIFVAVAIIHV